MSMRLSLAKHFAKCMCHHQNSNTKLSKEEKKNTIKLYSLEMLPKEWQSCVRNKIEKFTLQIVNDEDKF